MDALQEVSSLRSVHERRLVLELLRDKLGNGFHVNEYPETRAHLFSIARTCHDRRGGLTALAEALRDLEPGSLAVAQACRLIEDMSPLDLVADFDREQLFEMLHGIELPQLTELCQRVLGPAAPHPDPGLERLVDVWFWLEDQNSRADGLPPALVFVEQLAARVGNGLAARLRWWADRQAERMGLTDQMRSLRGLPAPPVATGADRLYLLLQLERDLVDENRYVLSHWRQAGDRQWRPERGEDRTGGLTDIERHVAELIDDAEADWAMSTDPIALEFILPRELVHLPLDRWVLSAEGGIVRRLGTHYQVSVRSLERMRKRSWQRQWRSRWRAVRDHTGAGYVCHQDRQDHLDELQAVLADRGDIAVVLLDHRIEPSAELGPDALTVALREGVPIVLWCRDPDAGAAFATAAAELVARAGLHQIRESVRTMRGKAHRVDTVDQVGAHVSLLWDDPERLIDLGEPGAPRREVGR
ncbi:hypothetical protein [Kutzneria sp. NPDC052558]|uniref:VMAP-C domain-containing protein n=1 Tax=Kutzneria sp. NPDC052558 TaxID=3364121 RepID=UPI0037CA12E4